MILYGKYQKYVTNLDEIFQKHCKLHKIDILKISLQNFDEKLKIFSIFSWYLDDPVQVFCMAATKNTHPISTKLSKKVLKGLK